MPFHTRRSPCHHGRQSFVNPDQYPDPLKLASLFFDGSDEAETPESDLYGQCLSQLNEHIPIICWNKSNR